MLDLVKNAIANIQGGQETSPNSTSKFVILSVPRTGSNFLCSTLDSHPEVLCHPELFHLEHICYSKKYLKSGGERFSTPQKRDRSPKSFMNQIWQQEFDCRAIGFKLMLWQNKRAFNLVLKNKSIKKILLFRNNKLKTYVSEKIAKKKKVWMTPESNLEKKEQNARQLSITVKPKYFYEYITIVDKFYESLRKKLKVSNQVFLEIAYEELLGRENEAVKLNILEFIGVSENPEYLKSNLKKQNPQPLSELIENFYELEEALKGTELEPYLYASDF